MPFSMPLGVSLIRGVALPALGSSITLLVTTPPMEVKSIKLDSSLPLAAHPEAVKTGLASLTPKKSQLISTAPLLVFVTISDFQIRMFQMAPCQHRSISLFRH